MVAARRYRFILGETFHRPCFIKSPATSESRSRSFLKRERLCKALPDFAGPFTVWETRPGGDERLMLTATKSVQSNRRLIALANISGAVCIAAPLAFAFLALVVPHIALWSIAQRCHTRVRGESGSQLQGFCNGYNRYGLSAVEFDVVFYEHASALQSVRAQRCRSGHTPSPRFTVRVRFKFPAQRRMEVQVHRRQAGARCLGVIRLL